MSACHNINKSADSQTNNKSSDNNNKTAEFYKTFIKPSISQPTSGSENKKILEKSQIGWRQTLVPSLHSVNTFLVIAVKNCTELDFNVF